MKKTLRNLFVAVATLFTVSANAQVIDSIAEFKDGEITDDVIVYAKVTLNDIDQLGTYNCGITLSQDTIKAWADYSCFVRFNNVSNANYTENTIDFRDGGAFGTPLNIINFETGGEYHVWFDVQFTALTYTAYVQPSNSSKPIKICENAAFRKADPTSLKYISVIRHPTELANTIAMQNFQKVNKIAIPSVVNSVSSSISNSVVAFYPNPVNSVITISNAQNISNISIYDITGKLVLSAIGSDNLNVSKLTSGPYIVKMNMKDASVLQQMLLKK